MKTQFIILFLFFSAAQSQQGTLLPAFGDNGHALADLSAQNRDDEWAMRVLIQSDGKRVVAMERYPYLQLLRLNADGSYDDTFGEGGFSEGVNLRVFGSNPACAAIQADGKVVAAGETEWNSTTMTDFGVARWNTDGTLDATFGDQGMAVTSFGYWEEAKILKIQPDGKILAAGETRINNVTYLAFARYHTDGSPDSTFGFAGKHVNPIFSGVNLIDMGLTPDGKIMILGERSGSSVDFVLARFLATGPIDVSFDSDGYDEYDDGGTYSPFMNCMEIQSDGKLLLGGSLYNGVNSDMVVERYDADGTTDLTFHGDGRQTTHIGGSESVLDLVVQPNGMIVAAGRVFYSGLPTVFALARYEGDGDLDGTFGVAGTQITSFSGYEGASAVAVVLHADGDITAAGGASNNYTSDVAVATYDLQGTPDVDGYPVQRVTAWYADNGATIFQASAVQTDGKLVAAGRAWNGTDYDFVVARFNVDGTPDAGFGDGGHRLTHFPSDGTGDELAGAVAIQADGKIVATGQFFNGIVGGALPVARYNPDGTPDSSFDADGVALIEFEGIFEDGNAIVIQPDGKILIGGEVDNFVTDFDFSLVRLNSDGSPDGSFGTGGMVSTDFGYQDIVFGLALLPDGKILATGNTSLPNSFDGFDFCTVRYNADGSVDSSFGTDGRVTTDFDGGIDFAQAIALQPDGKIVVGGGAPVGNDFEFAIARYTADGTPDSAMDGDGRQTTALDGYDAGMAVAVQPDGRIVLAGFTADGGSGVEPSDYGIVRYKTDGTLDEFFGTAGKVVSDFGEQEWAYSLALYDTVMYATGTKRLFREFTATDKYFGIVAAYLGGPPPADEMIEELGSDIDTLLIQAGAKQSLKSKLANALARLAAGDTSGACNALRAFLNEVNAQAGKKKLTAAQAAQLQSDAGEIMTALGCPLAKPGEGSFASEGGSVPTRHELEQNYPNPFNPATVIRYAIPLESRVTLKVYDVLGREVATIVDEIQGAGFKTAEWDATGIPSGLYFYRLHAGDFDQTRKLVILK